jgi:hypothetical protein
MFHENSILISRELGCCFAVKNAWQFDFLWSHNCPRLTAPYLILVVAVAALIARRIRIFAAARCLCFLASRSRRRSRSRRSRRRVVTSRAPAFARAVAIAIVHVVDRRRIERRPRRHARWQLEVGRGQEVEECGRAETKMKGGGWIDRLEVEEDDGVWYRYWYGIGMGSNEDGSIMVS